MKIATRHGPDQRHGHRRRGARGAFNCCPRPPRRAARGKSREGRRAPSCRGCRVHRRLQFPTNSRLSFPSLFSLLFLGPPHARQDSRTPQGSPSTSGESSKRLLETPRKGRGLPSRAWKPGGPRPTGSQGRAAGEIQGPTAGGTPRSVAIFYFIFLYVASRPGREGEKNFKFTSGRAPWGSRSNLRAGCLSAAAEKRIAQGLSLSRSWIKLQTQTPPFSTQQTVVANAAIWTLKTHYE